MKLNKSNKLNKLNKLNNNPSLGKSIGHGIAGGFGVGAGIEASRAVIGGLFGSENKEICKFEKENFEICLNNGDKECKDLMELLNNCYKSQK